MYDEEKGSRCANCGKRIEDRWQLEEGFCTRTCKKKFEGGVSQGSVEREASKLFDQYLRGGIPDPLASSSRTRL